MSQETLSGWARKLRAREISSRELTQLYLDRIERLDPQLNSFITVTAESALAQADAADARLADGEQTPLLGVPVAQKDIFCTEGVRTSCGSRMLDPFVSPYDATVVERMNAAGAVMLGKTNMDEFAMGSSNETSFYGPVRNPGIPSASRAFLRRFRRGSRRAPGAWGDRYRYRRLDPPAGRVLRHYRAQADLRARVALRHDRLRLQPRPGRPDGRDPPRTAA